MTNTLQLTTKPPPPVREPFFEPLHIFTFNRVNNSTFTQEGVI